MRKRAILFFIFLFSGFIFGQTDSLLVKPSPDGIYLFVSGSSLHPDNPADDVVVEAKVYRSDDGNNFIELGTVRRAETLEDFKNITGEQFLRELLQDSDELNSEQDLWNFIKQNQNIEDYGFLALNTNFLIALGTAYLDKSAQVGEDYTYRVDYLDLQGNKIRSKTSEKVNLNQPPNIFKPTSNKIIEDDSTIIISWKSKPNPDNEAFYGRVYKSPVGENNFNALEELIFATNTDTGITYVFRDENLKPESSFKYYLQPMDLVKQPGPVSDTVTAYSINFNNLPLMGNSEAKDTTGGIYLWWEKTPTKPYLTGIEIQRSRTAGENYVVLDTVNIQDTSFLDDKVLPNIRYFYRLKLLSYRNDDLPPSSNTSGVYTNKFVAPDAPQSFNAENIEDNIKLTWEPSPNLDIYSYFVYRGVTSDSMKIISDALTDTSFIDTSKQLDGRTTYLYGVTAVNYNEMESDFSKLVSIKPDRTVLPPEPFGMTGYVDGPRIRLSWQNMKNFDSAIKGYNIYRRDFQDILEYKNNAPASETAKELGFVKLNKGLVESTFYDDVNVTRGNRYQYAISTVDLYNVESKLSPISNFSIENFPLNPPANLSGRSTSDGIQIFWGEMNNERVNSYAIYRRTRNQKTPQKIATVKKGESSYIDTKTSMAEFYFYSVSTISKKNLESALSEEVGIKAK